MQSVLIVGVLTHFKCKHQSCEALCCWLVKWLPACCLHTCAMSADVSLSPPTASRCCGKQLADYRAAPGRYQSSLSQFYIVNGVWTMKLYTNYDDPPVALAVNDVLWISQRRAGASTDKQMVRQSKKLDQMDPLIMWHSCIPAHIYEPELSSKRYAYTQLI